MFRQILNSLKSLDTAQKRPDDLRIAVAMLLIEAAHRDDTFGPEERSTIENLLKQKFTLTAEESAQLMIHCEEMSARTTQLHPYTNAVFQRMDPRERITLIEMLWEVAYADGVLDAEEDGLIRKLAALIYVEDRERIFARQRVLERRK